MRALPSRSRLAALIVALAAAGGTAPAAVAAAPPVEPVNWVLYEVTLRQATGLGFRFAATERLRTTEPSMQLVAVRDRSWHGSVRERGQITDTSQVTQPDVEVAGPVSLSEHVDLYDESQYGRFDVNAGIVGAPEQPVLLLFASLTGHFHGQPSLTIYGSATYRMVASGRGAAYLPARSPAAEGAGVGVNGFGPARTTTRLALDTSAVFAVSWFNCRVGTCAWDGTAPDGATATMTMTGNPDGSGRGTGSTALAGPAGTWRWSVDGPGYNGRSAAGYVPIGDAWIQPWK